MNDAIIKIILDLIELGIFIYVIITITKTYEKVDQIYKYLKNKGGDL